MNPTEHDIGVIALTDSIAHYCSAKFLQLIADDQSSVPFPSGWSFDFLHECDQMIAVLYNAYKNRRAYPRLLQSSD
jgi:hypothetical protein